MWSSPSLWPARRRIGFIVSCGGVQTAVSGASCIGDVRSVGALLMLIVRDEACGEGQTRRSSHQASSALELAYSTFTSATSTYVQCLPR
jgi:hypothetical protein